jgi:hypothetical protein
MDEGWQGVGGLEGICTCRALGRLVRSTELTVTSKDFSSEAGTGLVALVVEEPQEEAYKILHWVGNALGWPDRVGNIGGGNFGKCVHFNTLVGSLCYLDGIQESQAQMYCLRSVYKAIK